MKEVDDPSACEVTAPLFPEASTFAASVAIAQPFIRQ